MLALKEGVDIRNSKPEIWVGAQIVASCFADLKQNCTITSCKDGQHMQGSLHYKGYALDIRSRDVPTQTAAALVTMCKEALGAQFDFVVEGDHFHLEFDPPKA